MNDTILTNPPDPAFWPRVSTYEARVIEQTLAPPTHFSPGLHLLGATVESTYAVGAPALLDRLSEAGTPFVLDPCSLRFGTDTFLEVGSMQKLPYAPDAAISPQSPVDVLVTKTFAFQATTKAAAYTAPCLPWPGRVEGWLDLNQRILDRSAATIGVDVDRRPLIALIAPDWNALREPRLSLERLADVPIAAIYAQPTRLRPTHDSVEKLVAYVRFLLEASALGVPVIAGRVGAFGLVLQALGIPIFDSGLGEAESFDLASLTRRRTERPSKAGGGRRRRIYLEPLKSSVMADELDAILAEPELRSRFICQLECCRWSGWEGLADRRRPHYLHARSHEVAEVAAQPNQQLRIHHVHAQLQRARDDAQVVSRMLGQRALPSPSVDHIDRWLAVIARIAGVSAAA